MPKTSKLSYYAVREGRAPGIYTSWIDCEAQVKSFANAVYKKFNTEAEAIQFISPKSTSVSSTVRPHVVPESYTRTVAVPPDEKDCDIVYCDGACKGNGQTGSIAGIGVWWGHGDPRNISERCPGDQTNNRAELIAIARILETTPHLKRRLLIKSDSKYSIECVTSWIFNWTRNGFVTADGKPVKNRALIKYLAALLHVRQETSQTVEFKHVRGHVGIEGNEAADQLANLGATKPIVPERDWSELETQVLQSLVPVGPLQIADDDLEAYADGILDDDELAEFSGTSVDDVTLPTSQSKPQHLESGTGFRAYADSILDDDERAELGDTSVDDITLPALEPQLQHLGFGTGATQNRTSLSTLQQGASPPQIGDAELVAPRIVHSTSKLEGPSKPATITTQRSQSVPSETKRPTTTISKRELEAYADGILDDDELAELSDTGVDAVILPAPQPKRQHLECETGITRSRTSDSTLPHGASPPQMDTELAVPRIVRSASKLPSEGHSGPAAVTTQRSQSVPLETKRPTTTISKRELEMYAPCLLDDDELSALGKDGVFDSDF